VQQQAVAIKDECLGPTHVMRNIHVPRHQAGSLASAVWGRATGGTGLSIPVSWWGPARWASLPARESWHPEVCSGIERLPCRLMTRT
jgi:hypothetical protein